MSTNIDPSKVKAGDTVTLESGAALVRDVVTAVTPINSEDGEKRYQFETAEVPDPLDAVVYYVVGPNAWTLTDHQPAPAPEWKPGTSGTATISTCETSGSTTAQHGMWFRRGGVEPLLFMTDSGSSWTSHLVDSFVPDDAEALRRELHHLRAKVEGYEFGEATTIKLLRAEVERLSGDWRSLPEEVLERWASLSRAEAIRQAEQLSSSLKAQFAANAESAKIVAARWSEKEAVAVALGVSEVSNQAIHDAIKALQTEVERLRAARTLPTRDEVEAVVGRAHLGEANGMVARITDAVTNIFGQGGAAPTVTLPTVDEMVGALEFAGDDGKHVREHAEAMLRHLRGEVS